MDRIRNVQDLSQTRRWVMELLQNARDTAYPDLPIKVRIEYKPDSLKFSHTGKPFRIKDILSIINQVSSKQGDESTVGKFGTGFMSTFQLSQRVEIQSVLQDVDFSTGERMPYKPFRVLLDRSGRNSDAILDAISQSIEQLFLEDAAAEQVDFNPSQYNTTFNYLLDNDQSRECAHTGVSDLHNNIVYIFLFSDKLAEIELRYDGQRIVFRRGDLTHITDKIQSLSIEEILQILTSSKEQKRAKESATTPKAPPTNLPSNQWDCYLGEEFLEYSPQELEDIFRKKRGRGNPFGISRRAQVPSGGLGYSGCDLQSTRLPDQIHRGQNPYNHKQTSQ